MKPQRPIKPSPPQKSLVEKNKTHQAYLTKKAISKRGKEKQLEKELPWHLIPPEEREEYKAAELKQWKEHVDFQAVRPLSLEESDEVYKTVPPERFLNHAKRKLDAKLLLKAKARLCVAGQHDPDLNESRWPRIIPRSSIILALQVAQARGWKVSVGDIRAAKRGIPTLEPGQIIEVLKGVFGLSTSPKLWWLKLCNDLLDLELEMGQEQWKFMQNPIDPCLFHLCDTAWKTRGLLLTHVDDIIVMTEAGILPDVHNAKKGALPD